MYGLVVWLWGGLIVVNWRNSVRVIDGLGCGICVKCVGEVCVVE